MHMALKGWSGNLVGIIKVIILSTIFFTQGDQHKQLARKTPTYVPVLNIVTNSWSITMQICSCNIAQCHSNGPFFLILVMLLLFCFLLFCFPPKNSSATAWSAHDSNICFFPMNLVHKHIEVEPRQAAPQWNLVFASNPAAS